MNLHEFSKSMGKLRIKVRANMDRLMRKGTLAFEQTVTVATPVDTGFARSNFRAEIGRRLEGTVPSHAPGEKGSTAGEVTREAIRRAKENIDKYRGELSKEVHLFNNADYINKLNDGWSAQAPKGYIENALQVSLVAIRGAKIVV